MPLGVYLIGGGNVASKVNLNKIIVTQGHFLSFLV